MTATPTTTTTYQGHQGHQGYLADSVAVTEARLASSRSTELSVARRREAMLALDPLVQRRLPRLGNGFLLSLRSLTIYDAIYPASPAVGGHWTRASRWVGMFTHTIASYTVALAFDAADNPDHFIVSGAAETISAGVSEAALTAALDRARATGPLRTTSPHIFAGLPL